MRILLALVLAGSLTGCGTIVNLTIGVDDHESHGSVPAFGGTLSGLSWRTQIYGGIQGDIVGIGKCVRGEEGLAYSLIFFPLLVLVDFPLSLVADTLTLPYTIPVDLLHEPRKASSP
jgi:uncharacterized protein YceK